MIIALIIAVYICGWVVSWSALVAYTQNEFPTLARQYYRQDLAFSMFWSFFPPAWFIIPFMTGFYEHGFQILPKDKE